MTVFDSLSLKGEANAIYPRSTIRWGLTKSIISKISILFL